MKKTRSRFITIALALSLLMAIPVGPIAAYCAAQTVPPAAAQTQVPQPADNSVNWSGAGYGAGAVFCSLLYIPFKLTYAILGGLVGGGTYLVTGGNSQAANTVWRSSLGGDWVVTPPMLQGQEPLNFSGPSATPPAAATASSGTTTTATASSGNVAPIAPLPTSGASGASGMSATASTSAASGGRPLDHGAGPASGPGGGPDIE